MDENQTNVSHETSEAVQREAAHAAADAAAALPTVLPNAEDDAAAADRYAIEVVKNTATAESTAQDTSVVLFDAAPAFRALLDDKAADVPVAVIARRFHDAFVQAVATAAELAHLVRPSCGSMGLERRGRRRARCVRRDPPRSRAAT